MGSLGSRVRTPAGKPPMVILNYLASLWQGVSCEGSAMVAKFLVPGTLPWWADVEGQKASSHWQSSWSNTWHFLRISFSTSDPLFVFCRCARKG